MAHHKCIIIQYKDIANIKKLEKRNSFLHSFYEQNTIVMRNWKLLIGYTGSLNGIRKINWQDFDDTFKQHILTFWKSNSNSTTLHRAGKTAVETIKHIAYFHGFDRSTTCVLAGLMSSVLKSLLFPEERHE